MSYQLKQSHFPGMTRARAPILSKPATHSAPVCACPAQTPDDDASAGERKEETKGEV